MMTRSSGGSVFVFAWLWGLATKCGLQMTEMIGEERLPSAASRVTPAKNPAEASLRAGNSLDH